MTVLETVKRFSDKIAMKIKNWSGFYFAQAEFDRVSILVLSHFL